MTTDDDEPGRPSLRAQESGAKGGPRRRGAGQFGAAQGAFDDLMTGPLDALLRVADSPAMEMARQLDERDRLLRDALAGPAMEVARHAEAYDRMLRAVARAPAAEMLRQIEERDRVLRAATEGTRHNLDAIIEQSNRWASELREQAQPVQIDSPPAAETEPAWAIQSKLPELVEISARTSEQIGQLATIAKAGLEESQQLRTTMVTYTTESKRNGGRLTWLTVILAVLTALLLAKELAAWLLTGA